MIGDFRRLRDVPVDLPGRYPHHRRLGMDRYEVYKARERRRATLDAPTTGWNSLKRPLS